MIMDLPASLRYTNQLPQRRLWFGTLAAAAAWALHGFICFLISANACQNGLGRLGPLKGSELRVLLGVITIVLLGVAVTGGMTSFRNWRAVCEQRSLTHTEALNREAFMALVGVFLSIAFVVGIIWAGIPLILINLCIYAR